MARELLPHLRGLCLCLEARGPGPVGRRAPEEACRTRSVSGFQDRSSSAQESQSHPRGFSSAHKWVSDPLSPPALQEWKPLS